MWVSFPGLRGWWRSRAEKCPRSPRGEAGHSMLHVRAVEAPVCGGRTVSTSCWGSGVGGGGCKPQHGGPMGSRREVSVLGPRGPLLCLRLPVVRSRGVTRKPFRIVWNGFRATRYRSQPHHLHRRSVPLPRLRHVPTWLRSISASSVLSADPQGCTLVCLASPGQSWPHSIALCHLLSTDVVSCWTRRSSRAPGILALKLVRLSAQSPAGCRACTARTLWGAGVEVRVPLLSQMCPAGVLGPTSEPAGPL